jgi:hypothetical protein
MVHPLGSLTVRQQVVPLAVDIDVYRNTRPSGAKRFDVTRAELNGDPIDTTDANDFFAPAQFLEMTDDEKLASPSFEELPAGVTLGDDSFTHGDVINSDIHYETFLIDKKVRTSFRLDDYTLGDAVFTAAAEFGAAAQAPVRTTGAGKHRGAGLGIRMSASSYVVAGIDDLAAIDGFVGTHAQARAALRARLRDHPEDDGRLQVVGLHEGGSS